MSSSNLLHPNTSEYKSDLRPAHANDAALRKLRRLGVAHLFLRAFATMESMVHTLREVVLDHQLVPRRTGRGEDGGQRPHTSQVRDDGLGEAERENSKNGSHIFVRSGMTVWEKQREKIPKTAPTY